MMADSGNWDRTKKEAPAEELRSPISASEKGGGKGVPRPFRAKVFLFRSLAAIFAVHMSFGAYALVKCGEYARERQVAVNEECPEVSQRISELFSVATATVLSLLSAEMGNSPK